jgi:hypothetical protein
MNLYIPTMEAVLVECRADGHVRLEGEEWVRPTLQERRAIIHAAREQIAELEELIAMLDQEQGERDQ